MIQTDENFGSGSFIGATMQESADFFELAIADQARYLGWIAACPVVEELINPANTEPGRGAEAMVERYAAVNFWHKYIIDQTFSENPALGFGLRRSSDRRQDEPVGKFEPESVPADYNEWYAPSATLVGFAMPRLFIDHLQSGDDVPMQVVSGTDIVERAAMFSRASQERFLAEAAEGFVQSGNNPEAVLKRIASKGWLEEHNGRYMFNQAMLALREHAPTVWAAYESLTSKELEARDLAEFDPLSVEYEPTQEDLETVFERLIAAAKERGTVQQDEDGWVSVAIRSTLVLEQSEAARATGDELADRIELSLKIPIDQSWMGGGEELNVQFYYSQPGATDAAIGVLGYYMDKSVSHNRGVSYDIRKSPMSLIEAGLSDEIPETPGRADHETQEDQSSLADLDVEYREANQAINPDDIALLYRLIRSL